MDINTPQNIIEMRLKTAKDRLADFNAKLDALEKEIRKTMREQKPFHSSEPEPLVSSANDKDLDLQKAFDKFFRFKATELDPFFLMYDNKTSSDDCYKMEIATIFKDIDSIKERIDALNENVTEKHTMLKLLPKGKPSYLVIGVATGAEHQVNGECDTHVVSVVPIIGVDDLHDKEHIDIDAVLCLKPFEIEKVEQTECVTKFVMRLC